ncbi:HicB family protein [Actinokineospora alba]|uniref:HicB family protein n=1 Tax=Actinokineospora alba TaxID=504798 RepID=A0A1H0IH57_9PSEU|nr:toxin-antitoxin system HicB family antitoxin [Actinokineospora alba]TDP70947.1 HicB-like protein involved in pilus formation [Actinokineospora alba]SDI89416.1 HicB family protein [Actinokineospora alba]SDO30705.1 HicB family protein [Actinokineospora alba]
MDLNPYLAALRDDLATTASAGDETMRRAAAVLAAAIEPAARLAMMNALSDLAAEVTAALPDHVVDIRLDGRDVRVVVTETSGDTKETPPPPLQDGGDMSRMTLRLFEELKAKAEQAANAQGVSLNTFVQQALQGALHGKARGGDRGRHKTDGSRVQGWYRG